MPEEKALKSLITESQSSKDTNGLKDSAQEISPKASLSNGFKQARRGKVSAIEQISLEETIELRRKHIGKSCKLWFSSNPLKIVRAKGQYMYDETGREYLDCINNVCHVGHCHPHVVKASHDQMQILNTNSRFLHDNMVLYAERLVQTFPSKLKVVYFVNSGSEANDLALRLARAYTGSKEVITLDHAYHGHLTSIFDISPYKFDQPGGGGCPEGTHVVPVPDVYRGKFKDIDHPGKDMGKLYAEEVEKVCNELKAQEKKPGCFIAESLQSCGGQIMYPPNYLREVYRCVREAGGICIADEVQVGFGRVGSHWWAFELQGEDIVPDVVTLGKPMGNGHPVSAVVTTEEVAESFAKSGINYFNTFGGNPVSCAVANAVMDVMEDEKLMENAKYLGNYMMNKMKQLEGKHSVIGDVRGYGMFFGIDLVQDRDTRLPDTEIASKVVEMLRGKKILLQNDGPHRNVLKFKSPLCFNKDDADRLVNALDEIFTELSSKKVT